MYRVEFPALGIDESVRFRDADIADVRKQAKEWAIEDGALVLIWDFAAGMYVGRFDGRPGNEECDGCGELSATLHGDRANPDAPMLCVICRCG